MMQIVECPRDAMQGLKHFIPTEKKVAYLNELLKVGFHTLDFGSFVSPKAIPQLKDTEEVLEQLDLSSNSSRLLAIVANVRGAQAACKFDAINDLGFPLSVSETFQQRNTNKSIQEALDAVKEIKNLCQIHGKSLVVYLSMGFGNPYGDPFNEDVLVEYGSQLEQLGANVIALSDTIGVATESQIRQYYSIVSQELVSVEVGLHLHATPQTVFNKMAAAYAAGCRRMDGAIKGFGGCPMAKDELTGNMATEEMIRFLVENHHQHGLNLEAFESAMSMAPSIFY